MTRSYRCDRCDAVEFEQALEFGFWLPPICPVCFAENEESAAIREARNIREQSESRLRRARLPRAYFAERTLRAVIADVNDAHQGATPEWFSAAVAACSRLLRGQLPGRSGIYLSGPAGTFKTSLAAATLAAWVRDEGRAGLFVSYPQWLSDLYATYGDTSTQSEAELVWQLQSVPALVLDDLGAERATEHATLQLFKLLDYRYRTDREAGGKRWLIVTSNRPMSKLGGRIERGTDTETAGRIMRRLSEMLVDVSAGETVR